MGEPVLEVGDVDDPKAHERRCGESWSEGKVGGGDFVCESGSRQGCDSVYGIASSNDVDLFLADGRDSDAEEVEASGCNEVAAPLRRKSEKVDRRDAPLLFPPTFGSSKTPTSDTRTLSSLSLRFGRIEGRERERGPGVGCWNSQ